MKKWLIILLKGAVAITAMYIAFRHVNMKELKALSWDLSLLWLLPAFICFNASQFISAYRLLQYYRLLKPEMDYRFNLQLYYQGMFYNLFLPGGVGGDVYKVMVLKNRGLAWIPATKATLLDRITGLIVLLAIPAALINFIEPPFPGYLSRLAFPAMLAGFIVYWFIVRYYFKPFGAAIGKAALLSVGVQVFQLLSFFCLLLFLRALPGQWMQYAILFFAGSVIAALPISIGGIGTRELAMATGAAWLHVSQTIAVSASIFFYIITALSAIAGWLGARKRRF